MQHPAAHDGQQRQDAFERGPVTSRENADIAGIGAVTATRDRTIDSSAAAFDHLGSQTLDLGLVGGGHLHPDLAGADLGQHLLHHRIRGGGAGQAGDDRITGLHQLGRAAGGFAALGDKCLDQVGIQVMHGDIHAIAQQAARQFAADITQSDKSNFQSVSPYFSGSLTLLKRVDYPARDRSAAIGMSAPRNGKIGLPVMWARQAHPDRHMIGEIMSEAVIIR